MRPLKPCGTPAAYRRHQRHGEPIDEPCDQAWKRYYNAWSRQTYHQHKHLNATTATTPGGTR